jgi:L,D-transpeptidase catalytic domain
MRKVVLFMVMLFFLLTEQSIVHADGPDQMIIINKVNNQLYYFDEGTLKRQFPVATGKGDTPTPEGVFTLANKIKNRPWYKENIPGGAPNNPLGKRWMGLKVGRNRGHMYGIHGNIRESSIGHYVTNGCIRMHNNDVYWLFNQVAVGTPVIVTRFHEKVEEIASRSGYRVMSWDGDMVDEFQIGRVVTLVPMKVYSYNEKGEPVAMQWIPANTKYQVYGMDGKGSYTIGSNKFLLYTTNNDTKYEPVPSYIKR